MMNSIHFCAVLTRSVVSDSLWPYGLYPSVHGDSPGKNTGVGCHALLQGIFFSTQGLNPGLSHCRLILYCLSRQSSPRIQEWGAYPFSRGTSQPRKWTWVSCTAGRFFTSWATREAQEYWSGEPIPSPGDLPDPRTEPGSPASQVDSLSPELTGKP